MHAIPIPADSFFLSEVIEAFRKRSRAIKHQGGMLAIERVVEVTDGEKRERLEIECRIRKRQRVCLLVWDDRALWLHAAESIPKSGWKFQFTESGRFAGAGDARMLISAFEATMSAVYEMTAADTGRLTAIWAPLIAKRPQPIA